MFSTKKNKLELKFEKLLDFVHDLHLSLGTFSRFKKAAKKKTHKPRNVDTELSLGQND